MPDPWDSVYAHHNDNKKPGDLVMVFKGQQHMRVGVAVSRSGRRLLRIGEWPLAAHGVLIAAVLLLAAGPAASQTGQTTYTSTTFNLADWSQSGPYSSPVAGGTMTLTAETGDGNPGDYARVVLQMPPNPSCPTGSWGFALRGSATFDPSVDGAISSVDFDFDSRVSPVENNGGAVTIAVEQDGFIWAALAPRAFVTNGAAGWQSYPMPGLVATDFVYASSWRQSGQPANPDFSATASPLTFGFGVGASRGSSSFDALCANPPPNGLDVDNWAVTVNSVPPAAAGQIEFAAATYSVAEGAGSVTLDVRRVAGSAGAVTVDYATVAETATSDVDYTYTSGTLTFAAGVTQLTVQVPILDDSSIEPAETFRVDLANPSGGATLGAQTTAVVTIGDDDQGNDLAAGITMQPTYTPVGNGWQIDVEMTLSVSNRGNGTVSDVFLLLDTFPPGAGDYQYVSDDSGGTFAIDLLGQWQWTIGTIPPLQTVQMHAVFRKVDPTQGAELEIWAEVMQSVAPTLPDPDPTNDRGVSRIPVGGADLGLTMQASRQRVTNGGADFFDAIYDATISYYSPIDEPGRNAVFHFNAPGSIASVSPMLPECGNVTGSAGRQYECVFPSLTQGFSLSIRVSVSAPQTATADAYVTSDSFDPDTSNDMASASVDIPVASIATGNSCDGGISFLGQCFCFIATAAYGTPWQPNVRVLREFRDRWLLTNAPGRAFVAFYYRNSPPLARWIVARPWARALTRDLLTPVVLTIRYPRTAGALLVLLLFGAIRLSRNARRARRAPG